MNRLTHQQTRTLADFVRPMGGCLVRLKERMERADFDRREAHVYQLVRAAEGALHELWVELHYRSCESTVGRSARGS